MLFHCFNVLSSRFPECQFRKAGVHIINYSHLVFNWSSSSSFIDLIQYNIILYITLPRMPVDINYLWCIKYINRKKNKKYSTYNHIISTYHNINFKQIFDYLLWFFCGYFGIQDHPFKQIFRHLSLSSSTSLHCMFGSTALISFLIRSVNAVYLTKRYFSKRIFFNNRLNKLTMES